jgi:hypothetical protein
LWEFSGLTFDDESVGLGEEIFVGTDEEARLEATRRANEWEDKNDALLCKVFFDSQGVVSKGP